MKFLRKLIKGGNIYGEKYFVVYKDTIFQDYYKYEYCNERTLKRIIEKYRDLHIFNTIDEYKIETILEVDKQ